MHVGVGGLALGRAIGCIPRRARLNPDKVFEAKAGFTWVRPTVLTFSEIELSVIVYLARVPIRPSFDLGSTCSDRPRTNDGL